MNIEKLPAARSGSGASTAAPGGKEVTPGELLETPFVTNTWIEIASLGAGFEVTSQSGGELRAIMCAEMHCDKPSRLRSFSKKNGVPSTHSKPSKLGTMR